MIKPSEVNILGKVYKIIYCDKPSDVDVHRRESLWGQIDYWTLSIRIYDDGLNSEAIFHAILHEVLHGIVVELHLSTISKATDHEDVVDLLSMAFADVLERNNWLRKE